MEWYRVYSKEDFNVLVEREAKPKSCGARPLSIDSEFLRYASA